MALSILGLAVARRVCVAAAFVTTALFAAGCGDTTELVGDNICGFSDPDCLGCAPLGGCCLIGDNCPVATICNTSSEPLFDESAPENTCVKVTCDTDADCDPPKVCGLERICKTPVCQVDADCTAGDICIAGACASAPNVSDVASCEVVSKDSALDESGTLALVAVAKNQNGVVLPGISFGWASSDQAVVSISGSTATGGTALGTADVTASVEGSSVMCSGTARIFNYPAVPAAEARVVVVVDGIGAPVEGATVELDAGRVQTAVTDSGGAATFTGINGSIGSVTVTAVGYQFLTVVQPGTNDIVVPLPREVDDTRAGGFRGLVDISATRSANIQVGFAGPALPSNLLDFGLDALVGDLIPTEIDAPELGIDLTGSDAADLPGGLLLAIGAEQFSADGDGIRCQGVRVMDGQLGCFAARAPEGLTAGWALAGQLKLSEVSSIAGTISDTLGASSLEEVPLGDLLVSILPLFRSLNHAISASLDIEYFPKVDGAADFALYQRHDLTAGQELGVLSVVNVPDLPQIGTSTSCADAAVILAGASLQGRGLVPLGVSGGLDVVSSPAADCKVDGVAQAFGSGSSSTEDGQLALSMAPLHSGAEGSDVFLLLVAADIDRLVSSELFQATAIVDRPDRVLLDQAITGTYLSLPTGSIDAGAAQITLGNAVAGATLNRYELSGGGQRWLVYAPPTVTTVALPDSAGPRTVTADLSDAYLLSLRMDGQFSDAFELGSGKTLDRLVDTVTGFSVQQCSRTAGAPCQLQ